jgi:hypothetical protein
MSDSFTVVGEAGKLPTNIELWPCNFIVVSSDDIPKRLFTNPSSRNEPKNSQIASHYKLLRAATLTPLFGTESRNFVDFTPI